MGSTATKAATADSNSSDDDDIPSGPQYTEGNVTLDRATGLSVGLIRTFTEGSLAPSSPAKQLVQPTNADLHTNSTLQGRRTAATARRAAARTEAVAAARAKAEQLVKKRKKDAPGEGCQPINRPGGGMMVELGLAPRCPSPGEMVNETETLPDEVHHDTLPGEEEIHVFVPTVTGGECTGDFSMENKLRYLRKRR